jgi:hypothetical protein
MSHGSHEHPLRPILVITPGRSGGSVLMEALSRHPNIVVCSAWPHEQRPAAYALKIGDLIAVKRSGDARGARTAVYKNGISPFTPLEVVEEALYTSNVVAPFDDWIRQRCSQFYELLAQEYGKRQVTRFAEKVGARANHRFRQVFERVYTIYLIRNPRDAVASARRFFAGQVTAHDVDKQAGDGSAILKDYLQGWCKIADAIQCDASSERTTILRYEDVVMHTDATLRGLFGFLDLDESACIQPCLDVVKQPVVAAHVTSRDIQSSVGRWQSESTGDWDSEIVEMVGRVAERLGYD